MGRERSPVNGSQHMYHQQRSALCFSRSLWRHLKALVPAEGGQVTDLSIGWCHTFIVCLRFTSWHLPSLLIASFSVHISRPYLKDHFVYGTHLEIGDCRNNYLRLSKYPPCFSVLNKNHFCKHERDFSGYCVFINLWDNGVALAKKAVLVDVSQIDGNKNRNPVFLYVPF